LIITQTPLRVSFFGGGTDFPDFFMKEEGCVLTSAIDRYIFVIIKRRFDEKIRIGYSRTELVDTIDQIQHELVREAMRKTGIRSGVEIATMGDIPSSGSGMGSSSTVTVGLLNAMYHHLNEPRDVATLAREACEIEINVLGKPIGMQDQYVVAHGGQRFIRFLRDGQITVEPLCLDEQKLRRFGQNLMLFFTNTTRRAESILEEQVNNITERLDVLREMKKLAVTARDCLCSGCFDEFGILLDEGWRLKKQLASKISNGYIDELYDAACKAGALGGKITGAGGGGFLLLYCPQSRQDNVRVALRDLPELPFDLECSGSKVIFNYARQGGFSRCVEYAYS
jgi:D-glycero-alpha-D-manno-heptose-7-phosphate kinase